jgi:PIN domain nuclease of toxin-antitoxin system
MRILVDTQIWLWMQADPARLSDATRQRLVDVSNEILLSAASAWEIAIKYALGKLPLPLPPLEYVPSRMQISGTAPLPVLHAHALRVAELPAHHRDPFDRLIVAQAQLESLPVLSADRVLAAYDIELLLP